MSVLSRFLFVSTALALGACSLSTPSIRLASVHTGYSPEEVSYAGSLEDITVEVLSAASAPLPAGTQEKIIVAALQKKGPQWVNMGYQSLVERDKEEAPSYRLRFLTAAQNNIDPDDICGAEDAKGLVAGKSSRVVIAAAFCRHNRALSATRGVLSQRAFQNQAAFGDFTAAMAREILPVYDPKERDCDPFYPC